MAKNRIGNESKFLEILDTSSFLIFYGSQLGQAKSIAEGVAEIAEEYGFKSSGQAYPLNEVKEIADLSRIKVPIVIISSTTGDGEPPENADRFFRKLRRKTLKPGTLNSVRYTILGLGDTNYNNFCNCAKTIHQKFQELGAELFYEVAWADDAVGSDQIIDTWLENLWVTLRTETGLSSDLQTSIIPTNQTDNLLKMSVKLTLPPCPKPILCLNYINDAECVTNFDPYNPPMPYPSQDGSLHTAVIKGARILTKASALKTTLEVRLAPSVDSVFDFEPGDAIGIICENPKNEVKKLINRLQSSSQMNSQVEITQIPNSKGKFPGHLPNGVRVTLYQLFTQFVDIRSPPKKVLLRLLGDSTENPDEKSMLLFLASREGSTKYEETIRAESLSILDILETYPGTNPKVEWLLEHLPRLVPRSYSISSSPLVNKDSFTITFNIVQIPQSNGRQEDKLGICTGFLYRKSIQFLPKNDSMDLAKAFEDLDIKTECESKVIFYKRKNHCFRLPVENAAPIVMVGPGAGVAPFVGFVQHRLAQKRLDGKSIGKMNLFFGCRFQESDFLYKDELESAQNEEDAFKLFVAFSRDPSPEITGVKYVQDLMEKEGEMLIGTLFDEEGYLFVCGDAKNMAKDVRDRLCKILASIRKIPENEAFQQISTLISTKRYLQDIWT